MIRVFNWCFSSKYTVWPVISQSRSVSLYRGYCGSYVIAIAFAVSMTYYLFTPMQSDRVLYVV